MAGTKRNKIKKAFSPVASSNFSSSPSKDSSESNPGIDDTDGLLDDLLAQIDSKQQPTDINEAATVLSQIENTTQSQEQKKSNRSRFEARQV